MTSPTAKPAGKAPSRTRTAPAAKTATEKPAGVTPPVDAPAAVEAPAAPTEQATGGTQKVLLELTQTGTSRNYKIFSAPEGSGCVGKLYVPFTTQEVKLLVVVATPAA